MSKKLESIKAEEIKLNSNGDLDVSVELQDLIAGGTNPEDTEEEAIIINFGCGKQAQK